MQYRINWLQQFGKLSGTKCEAIGEASEFGCRLVGKKGLEYSFSRPKGKEQIQSVYTIWRLAHKWTLRLRAYISRDSLVT